MGNKILKSLLIMAIMMMSFAVVFAAHSITHQVTFKVAVLQDPIPEPDPEGLRKPGNTVSGNIGMGDTIQIPGFDKSRILSYEIYKDGVCIGIWEDETDFLTQLANTEGSVEIRINFPGYFLYAWIDLPI